MKFIESITLFFKNYSNFKGKSTRSDFWYAQLFLILAGFLTTVIDLKFFKYTLTGQPVSDIFNILTIVPIYALSFRRLHDIGKSGWWVLLQLTIIGIIPLIYWYCKPSLSTEENNQNDENIYLSDTADEKNIWDETNK
jgi:uncharacterized membrane protein YhaH (DUF805 family)